MSAQTSTSASVRRRIVRRRRGRSAPSRPNPWTHLAAATAGAGVAWLVGWLAAPYAPRPPATGSGALLDPASTPPTLYEWGRHPEPQFPIPPYARFLKGVKIVLDPGHVGQKDRGGNWKRGPTGLREPEVNLRVAFFLREFLSAAGAEPLLTRESDDDVGLSDEDDLRARAELANRKQADLLLSIHHNAAARPDANYTAIFYHHRAPETYPASLCAARHLLTGLNDALRLERHIECGVLSDRLLYSDGLSVLRHARVPAVLTEASFHTNPEEEARLRDPVYNRREAYGLFLGLARWAQAGRRADRRFVRAGDRADRRAERPRRVGQPVSPHPAGLDHRAA